MPLRLELHDDRYSDPITSDRQRSPTHRGTVEVDYDYQAEQWVIDGLTDYPAVVQWQLYDEEGLRALWVRVPGTTVLVAKAKRFTGECRPCPGFLWLT